MLVQYCRSFNNGKHGGKKVVCKWCCLIEREAATWISNPCNLFFLSLVAVCNVFPLRSTGEMMNGGYGIYTGYMLGHSIIEWCWLDE